MATSGDIPSNITIGANQVVRRNAANTGFEAVTPSGTGTVTDVSVTTGANAGNLTAQHLKVTSGTSSVFAGSYIKVIRIS